MKFQKRLFALFLALLLPVAAMAESIDLSGMSVDELRLLRERIAQEIESRDPATIYLEAGKQKVLVDQDGFKIYLTGQFKNAWMMEAFMMNVAFENNSDQTYSVWAENMKLNGWSLTSSLMAGSTAPGEKKVTEMSFSPDSAMVTELWEMKELVFDIKLSDENYQPMKKYGPFKIVFEFEKED